MSAASPEEVRAPKARYRSTLSSQVILPMLLFVLVVVGALVAVFVLPRRLQVGIISDLLLTVFVLCPAALCLLPLTVVMVAGFFGMNRVHSAAARPLRKLEDASLQLVERTESTTDQINKTTIGISARFGAVYRLMGYFEQQEDDEPDEQ